MQRIDISAKAHRRKSRPACHLACGGTRTLCQGGIAIPAKGQRRFRDHIFQFF
ncbi:MAG: hypothetical protein ACT6RN_25925 [Agrobacterium sp.]|uniref:hypothetical protein n=1 Tax=Agrobacterium sp. TaxID=361 RepID=UPI00403843E5